MIDDCRVRPEGCICELYSNILGLCAVTTNLKNLLTPGYVFYTFLYIIKKVVAKCEV